MKKLCLILALVALFAFCSCDGSEPFVMDIDEAAEKLLSEVEYYEELYPVDLDMAKSLLELDDSFDTKIAMYIGSGASADMIIVAESADAAGLDEKISAFLDSQEELYASYMILEADKISHAVREAKENYIIVCVTEDTDGAKKAVKEILV